MRRPCSKEGLIISFNAPYRIGKIEDLVIFLFLIFPVYYIRSGLDTIKPRALKYEAVSS